MLDDVVFAGGAFEADAEVIAKEVFTGDEHFGKGADKGEVVGGIAVGLGTGEFGAVIQDGGFARESCDGNGDGGVVGEGANIDANNAVVLGDESATGGGGDESCSGGEGVGEQNICGDGGGVVGDEDGVKEVAAGWDVGVVDRAEDGQ